MTESNTCLTNDCSSAGKPQDKVLSPRVDISEMDDTLLLTVDMPGVEEKDIDITLHEHVLTIESVKKDQTFEGVSPYYVEHTAGRYMRRFKLTEEIERDQIEATLKDGVLRLTLPKAKAEVAQKIKVVSA